MEQQLRVQEKDGGARLDKFIVTRLPELSRAFAQQLIDEGFVRVNERARDANYRVRAGETIRVSVPPPQPTDAQPEQIPLAIIYEDEALIVINKPAGMVVHPAAGHAHGTLANAVLGYAPGLIIGNAERPGIVHRLDRDTSGLIVIAKTDDALKNLQQQFSGRTVHKTYLALAHGRVAVEQGKIDAPLARDPHDRKKFAVVNNASARAAVTYFRVLQRMPEYTLLQVEPQTGRTHQIRVHLAFIHHPVVGDTIYNRTRNRLGLARQFLHAWRIEFAHPRTGARLEFSAPLPDDLREALQHAGGAPDALDKA
jgi:23S rRNA pseudouridine1911/1915/1917 synthase